MRNEDMFDTNSLMFEISELRKENQKLKLDKENLTKQLSIAVVVDQCKHEYDYYVNNHGETVAVCSKCMNAYL